LHRLTATAINHLKPGKFYHDGGGLYLQVRPTGRSWLSGSCTTAKHGAWG
jgi:hypothetical protein